MNPSKPNVLMISVDDMNDWVGCLNGCHSASTPNIDALANRGVLFTNAHCPSPLCNPSRTAILTGLAPHVSGVYDNKHWWKPAWPDIDTLPMHFRNNGYKALGAGKVYHHTDGFNPPDQWDEYFDIVFDDPWDRDKANYSHVKAAPKPKWHPLNRIEPFAHEHDWGALNIPDAAYGDMQAIGWAEQQFQANHEKPFFMALGTFKPHIPWYAPQRFFDRFPKSKLPMPLVLDSDAEDLSPIARQFVDRNKASYEAMMEAGEWENAIQAYLACISFADEMIGKVLSALDASPYADNTAIIFYSDNGYHIGEKKHFTKCTLWERSTHVPFILVPPRRDRIVPSKINAPVNLQSIYPTLVDYCGLPQPPQQISGESLAPLMRGYLQDLPKATLTTYLPGNYALRTEHWRYIRYNDGCDELYHTTEDPDERRNLASDPSCQQIKKELAAMVPTEYCPEVAPKSAYEFDTVNYLWKTLGKC